MPLLKALHRYLLKLEDVVLVATLLVTLFIAVLQITLRNFFDSGIIWGDSFLSISVLWIGMAGAIFASRDNRHISIDLGIKFLSEKNKLIAQSVVHLFTAFICFIVAWYGINLVILEYEEQTLAFANIPVWLTVAIIPLGFAIMAMRYLISTLQIIFSSTFRTELQHRKKP